MLEGKRQKQVAGLLNKELSDIFQRMGLRRENYTAKPIICFLRS